ncbi:hypothetical protein [Achromobacter xylosoxidans]|uniref:hypothetical protein n=1 Tax=Alcaligenes xylosoxydans xylosoxydans TaxID=85698 RepID=UPI0010413BC9|nr:hypothetical protein [Achromobacter xylosoxidans]
MSSLKFVVRPSVVLPDHRPLFKVTQVLLVLFLASRARKSSILRLQLFNWVLKDDARKIKLSRVAVTQDAMFPAWGLDPTLDAAVSFAKGEGLIESSGNGVKLTQPGAEFCSVAMKHNLFDQDVDFLNNIGISITEKLVEKMVGEWV